MVAHVAEVLGDRHPGVDAGLPRHHRHVRGVGDDDGALGERSSGARVRELGQLGEHVGHLVAALAAADVDDHVGGAPLGDLLEEHGLAGAEAARDGGAAAPGDREHGVENPLAGQQRLVALEPAPAPAAARRTGQSVASATGTPRDGGDLVLYAVRCRRGRATRTRPLAPAAPARGTPGRRRPGTVPSTAAWRSTVSPSRHRPAASVHGARLVAAVAAPGTSQVGAPDSGRSSPSKTPPSRCGPSRADSGLAERGDRVPGGQAAGVLVGLDGDRRVAGSRRPRRAALQRQAPRARTSRRPRALDLQQGAVHAHAAAGSAGSPQPLQVEVGEGAVDQRADGGVDAAAVGCLGAQARRPRCRSRWRRRRGVARGCRREAPALGLVGAGLAPPARPCCAGLRMPRAGLRAGPRARERLAAACSAASSSAASASPRVRASASSASASLRACATVRSPSARAAARSLSASASRRGRAARPRSGSRARDCLWARSVMGASPRVSGAWRRGAVLRQHLRGGRRQDRPHPPWQEPAARPCGPRPALTAGTRRTPTRANPAISASVPMATTSRAGAPGITLCRSG